MYSWYDYNIWSKVREKNIYFSMCLRELLFRSKLGEKVVYTFLKLRVV